jgi:hypothetical protein
MADVTYSVEVQYLTSGSLVSMNAMKGVKEAEAAAKKMKAEAKHFGESVASYAKNFSGAFNNAFDSVASSLASGVGAVATGIGAALTAGFGLGLREMMRFNEEMENSQISIAAISRATGESSNMANGLRIASTTVAQMRKDAALLPGSFSDLTKIVQYISPALGRAGIGMTGSASIGGRIMAASKIEGISPDVAAREFAALVEGRATSRMPLFAKMLPLLQEYGINNTKEFNAKDEGTRTRLASMGIEKFTGRLDDPNSAIGVFSRSWNAVKETAIDNVRMSVGAVGGNLFEHIKDKVAEFNDIKSGKRGLAVLEKWGRFGEDVSEQLVNGFEKAFKLGADFLKSDWIPLVRNFTKELWWGVHGTLKRMENLFGGTGRLKHFLGDPLAFEKIAHAASMLAALRVGSSALGAGAGMVPGLIGAFGGGAAGAGALAAAAVPAIGVLAIFAVAVEGAVHAVTDTSSAFHSVARYLATDFGHSLKGIATNFAKVWDNIEPIRDLLGTVLLGGLTVLGKGVEYLTSIIVDGTNVMRASFDYIRNLYDPKSGRLANDQAADDAAMLEELHGKRNTEYMMHKVFDTNAFGELEKNTKVPNHTTHIHNVNIAVNSNQDPNRIARKTASIMFDYARNPRTALNSGNPVLSRGG